MGSRNQGLIGGQCTELCGINHGFMPIVVKAVSEEDFNQWVNTQPKVADPFAAQAVAVAPKAKLTREELLKVGKEKYEIICAACHRPDGKGMPPLYPALQNSSVAVGYPISRHIHLVLHGVTGTAMQAYKNQLTDEDLAAIVTYERNAWGNNTNDIVQPEDVAKVRLEGNVAPKMVNKKAP